MKRKTKKLLALLLCAAIISGTVAYADDDTRLGTAAEIEDELESQAGLGPAGENLEEITGENNEEFYADPSYEHALAEATEQGEGNAQTVIDMGNGASEELLANLGNVTGGIEAIDSTGDYTRLSKTKREYAPSLDYIQGVIRYMAEEYPEMVSDGRYETLLTGDVASATELFNICSQLYGSYSWNDVKNDPSLLQSSDLAIITLTATQAGFSAPGSRYEEYYYDENWNCTGGGAEYASPLTAPNAQILEEKSQSISWVGFTTASTLINGGFGINCGNGFTLSGLTTNGGDYDIFKESNDASVTGTSNYGITITISFANTPFTDEDALKQYVTDRHKTYTDAYGNTFNFDIGNYYSVLQAFIDAGYSQNEAAVLTGAVYINYFTDVSTTIYGAPMVLSYAMLRAAIYESGTLNPYTATGNRVLEEWEEPWEDAGYGIFQFGYTDGDKFTQLRQYAEEQGKSWSDPTVQWEFVMYQLYHTSIFYDNITACAIQNAGNSDSWAVDDVTAKFAEWYEGGQYNYYNSALLYGEYGSEEPVKNSLSRCVEMKTGIGYYYTEEPANPDAEEAASEDSTGTTENTDIIENSEPETQNGLSRYVVQAGNGWGDVAEGIGIGRENYQYLLDYLKNNGLEDELLYPDQVIEYDKTDFENYMSQINIPADTDSGNGEESFDNTSVEDPYQYSG